MITRCNTCGGDYTFSWTEAFDKFGFGDGDGQVETDWVLSVLQNAGYDAQAEPWGWHNVVIYSIKDKAGREQIPEHANVGYDDPRTYLPAEIVTLLDRELPD